MSDVAWAVPTALALVGLLLVVGIVVMVVRARRRSPRARAVAEAARVAAAEALLRLDDAARDLDTAFEASGALVDAESTTSLRRARAAALRARDRGFTDVADLSTSTAIPARRRVAAEAVRAGLDDHLARIERTRAELADWARAHGTPADRVRSAQERRDEVVRAAGDPAPLIAALRARFADDDWGDAADAARDADAALTDADDALGAADVATDPDEVDRAVFRATDAARRAARHLRAVEDAHRIALQAAENAEDEVAAARAEIAAARELAAARPDDCAPDAVTDLDTQATALEAAAAEVARRPRAAIETVARVRRVRDEVLREAPSARLRLEAARAALPGTLACARAALAAAEARDVDRPIDERLRLDGARRELAAARAATDAGQALANARAAWEAAAPR